MEDQQPPKPTYSSLWKAIIRPVRKEYTLDDLGPTLFNLKNNPKILVKRSDLALVSNQGYKLECSHFEIVSEKEESKEEESKPMPCDFDNERTYLIIFDNVNQFKAKNILPCVVYMHGNCSSRLEALDLLEPLLPLNLSLFCFDFAGCGMSEGDFVSLGWHERDDLEIVIEYLRGQRHRMSTLALWGRSMGAVTALMYAEKDLSVAGMVLDSPFSDLKLLVKDLAKQNSKVNQDFIQ